MQNQNSQARPQNYWNPSEQEEIIKLLTIIIDGQKAYGKDASIKDVYAYMKYKLDGKYSADMVCAAIDAYTDLHNDIPAPADLIKIINPPAPKITQSEYNKAYDQWKAAGFPQFDYYGGIVKDYERQQADDRGCGTAKKLLVDEKRSCDFMELEDQRNDG